MPINIVASNKITKQHMDNRNTSVSMLVLPKDTTSKFSKLLPLVHTPNDYTNDEKDNESYIDLGTKKPKPNMSDKQHDLNCKSFEECMATHRMINALIYYSTLTIHMNVDESERKSALITPHVIALIDTLIL
eukprot:52237_1